MTSSGSFSVACTTTATLLDAFLSCSRLLFTMSSTLMRSRSTDLFAVAFSARSSFRNARVQASSIEWSRGVIVMEVPEAQHGNLVVILQQELSYVFNYCPQGSRSSVASMLMINIIQIQDVLLATGKQVSAASDWAAATAQNKQLTPAVSTAISTSGTAASAGSCCHCSGHPRQWEQKQRGERGREKELAYSCWLCTLLCLILLHSLRASLKLQILKWKYRIPACQSPWLSPWSSWRHNVQHTFYLLVVQGRMPATLSMEDAWLF